MSTRTTGVDVPRLRIEIRTLLFATVMLLANAIPALSNDAAAARLFTVYYTINGTVRTSDGAALSGVSVSASNGSTCITGPDGFYSVTVRRGWSGSVSPSKAGWMFSPASRSYAYRVADNYGHDYTATPRGYYISGYIRTSAGSGISDVAVAADNGGGSTTSGALGYYRVVVPEGWSGTVTPSKAGCVLSPLSRSYSPMTADQSGQDYTVTSWSPMIWGYIRTSDGAGISEAMVAANNNGGSATTNASGYYALIVPEGWSGSVTPTKPGYGFNPGSKALAGVTADQGNQNFTARPAAVIYVDAAAKGSKDGTNWANAFVSLQDALAKAAFGDSIWVAEGMYWPDLGRSQYLRDRAATFQLRSGVALYGGFPAGGEWTQRNPFAHQSILSGDIGQVGVAGDNCYHVVTMSETGLPALLDGCVITGGVADDQKEYRLWDRGAGLYCAKGGLQVRNCTFVGNKARSTGGGVCVDGGDATFLNCIFSGNTANDGGALYRQGGIVALINCTIVGNQGIWRAGLACPTLVLNSILWGNQGRPGKTSYDELAQGCGILRATVNCCCVEGWKQSEESLGGTGNFSRDPLLVNAPGVDGLAGTPDDDPRLAANSPCIGKGDNTALPPEIRTDLEGKPRILGGTIDIGAYEFDDQEVAP